MHSKFAPIKYIRFFLACLTFVLTAGCGLGMDSSDRLERGLTSFEVGEFGAAIVDAKNILQVEPRNIQARILLGAALVRVGDGAAAEFELRRAMAMGADLNDVSVDLCSALLQQEKFSEIVLEIEPGRIVNYDDRMQALRMIGDSYLGLGNAVKAREYYSDVLRGDAQNEGARLGIVRSYVNESNVLQARQTLDQILDEDSEFGPAWLVSGYLSARMGEADRAVRDYTKAAELARARPDSQSEIIALSGLADQHLLESRLDKARSILERMNEISPGDVRSLLVAARVAMVDRDWVDAQKSLRHILRVEPDHRAAQILLGEVHNESGNLGQAEMYLAAAVAAKPEDPAARRLLAEVRLRLNKADDSRRVLAPIIAGGDRNARTLSLSASAMLRSGDIDGAAEVLRQAVADNPSDPALSLQLAFTYFRAGHHEEVFAALADIPVSPETAFGYQRDSLMILARIGDGQLVEAERSVRELVTRWPDRAEARILQGVVLAIIGNTRAASQSFSIAAELGPEQALPHWYLAQLYESEGDLASAESRYLQILDIRPNNARTMVAMAGVAVRRGDRESAKNWLNRARNADSNADVPRKVLALMLLEDEEFAASENAAREALKINDQDASLYNILGLAELNQEKPWEAELNFRLAGKIDPKNHAYRVNLSRSLSMRGNRDSAITVLEENELATLNNLTSGLMLAALKFEVGAIDAAMNIAERLQEFHPDSGQPYALEAELRRANGDLAGASAAYETALDIEASLIYAVRAYRSRVSAGLQNPIAPMLTYLEQRPLDTEMHLLLAQAYQLQNETGKSISEYEQVLTIAPDNFTAANNLAWSYWVSGDPRAEMAARRAFELRPENSSVLDTLGWILVMNGDYQEGIPLLRDAVKLGEGRAETRYHLAAALAQSGETMEAKKALQEILSKPDEFPSRSDAEELFSTL